MKRTLRDMVSTALLTAVVAALGLLPAIRVAVSPVPITVQTLGVMLAGNLLGARRGFFSQVLFLVLVAAGLPLLSGGRGGMPVLLGPSAGFLWAWPLGAAVIGFVAERARRYNPLILGLADLLGGIAVIYAMGIPVLGLVTGMGLRRAALSSMVFLPGDLGKVVIAAAVSPAIRRTLQLAAVDPLGPGRDAA